MNEVPTLTRTGLKRAVAVALIGEGFTKAVYDIEHLFFDFGVHWYWSGGDQFFTPEGLILIAEKLEEQDHKAEAQALRDRARGLEETGARNLDLNPGAPIDDSTPKPKRIAGRSRAYADKDEETWLR